PTLDWMNSYGMRWLMPFNGRWFYGDSLFIIDPWLLLVLGLGVWLSRRRERRSGRDAWRPARVALGLTCGYVITMLGLQTIAEGIVRRDLAGSGWLSHELMVTASPADPVRWRVYADDGARYWRGTVSLAPGVSRRLTFDEVTIEKNANDPAAVAAARSEPGRRFLDWARLPYYQLERGAGTTRVRIIDARYGASVEVMMD
ncbi:MAG: metal-dependent hydrolase, partial [Gemmatimonadota bacterium]|nr:metal-dependent hydrolase [Gemmatimonadota bacterium]